MSTPTVLRVQPIYEKAKGKKRTLQKTHGHNLRTDGDLRHVDSSRTCLNKVLLGTTDIVADVQNIASKYVRSSYDGPISGELILTANAKHFKGLTEAEKTKWAEDSLAWALHEFDGKGQGRVANAVWHRDEKAEHLHIVIVPVALTTIGNQYKKSIVEAINYSAVLGKPPGGEKHLPPAERRWGKKQTSYANFMAEKGHSLIRGVRNRKLKNVSPEEWKMELSSRFSKLVEQIKNVPDSGSIEFSKQEIIQFIMTRVDLETLELTTDQKALQNQVASLEQALSDVADALGCSTPAYLPQYCSDFVNQWREKYQKPDAPDISKVIQMVAEEGKQERSKPGQRKTKEERRANRLLKKQQLLSEVPNISSSSNNLTRGYHHESRVIIHSGKNYQQYQQVEEARQ